MTEEAFDQLLRRAFIDIIIEEADEILEKYELDPHCFDLPEENREQIGWHKKNG